jgi:type I restriction enzyme S subunit
MRKVLKYPNYKESDVEWLGSIPEHWKIVKAKRILREVSIKNHPDEPLLAATQTKGVIPKSLYENTTVTASKNFETLKLVRKGDFVISLRSFQGGIEYAHYQGIISPAYTILEPQEEVIHNYYRYLLKSKRYISGLTLLVTGIREGQNIDTSKFKDSFLPLPPKEEQTAIARFLDYKLAKINRFIQKKKQLIKLLNEQKAAIINQAVTKGLDPNAKMKDSGIEWLGEIPEHWEKHKLKYLISKPIAGAWGAEPQNDDNDITCVRVADFSEYEIKTDNLTIRNIEAKSEQILKPGDLLLEKSGGGEKTPVGRVVLFNQSFKAVTSNFVSKFSTKIDLVSSEYLLYIFKLINSVRWNFRSLKQTTGIQNIDTYQYMDNWVFIPKIEEQKIIVNHIKSEFKILDETISKIEKEIALVEEYKTALIAEAVTGKIDVRGYEVPEISEEETYEDLEEEISITSEDAEAYQTVEE